MRITAMAAVLVAAVSTFLTAPGAQAGAQGTYVSGGVAVARTGAGTVVDNGAVVCDDGNGAGVGGVCLPFGGGDAVGVVDDQNGEDVAFQVCVDNNGDGLCTPDDPDPNCADDIVFSHDDGGAFYNPVGPVPTGFRPGCPGGAFDGYVVFLCEGAHAVTANNPHVHPATTGTVTVTTGGEGSGTFCGGLFGKPYYGTYTQGNLGCGLSAVWNETGTGQNVEGTVVGGPWHENGVAALIRCYLTINGVPTPAGSSGTGTGVALGPVSFEAPQGSDVEVCTEVNGVTLLCVDAAYQEVNGTGRWFVAQPVR